jgi:hypothetical protein
MSSGPLRGRGVGVDGGGHPGDRAQVAPRLDLHGDRARLEEPHRLDGDGRDHLLQGAPGVDALAALHQRVQPLGVLQQQVAGLALAAPELVRAQHLHEVAGELPVGHLALGEVVRPRRA